MTSLTSALRNGVGSLAADRHVTLLNGQVAPIRAGDPDAIVSPIPEIRVDAGRGVYRGRRKRVTLNRGAEQVTLLTHTRPLPGDPDQARPFVHWGADRRQQPVAACCTDADTHKLHLLLNLERAAIIDHTAGTDPVTLVVDLLFARPLDVTLRELSQNPEELWIGPQVQRRIRWLLEHRVRDARSLFRADVRMLERFLGTDHVPPTLARHLQDLKQAIQKQREQAARVLNREDVDLEIARLCRVVSSRACAALHFEKGEITGLLNPRLLGGRLRLKPLMFRLQVGAVRRRAVLYTWCPLKGDQRKQALCLGEADSVLRVMEANGDIYGLVDVVLNYVETNLVGAIALDGGPPQRSLTQILADYF